MSKSLPLGCLPRFMVLKLREEELQTLWKEVFKSHS